MKASELLEFHIPSEMAGWDLQESLERTLSYDDLKGSRTIAVGELYDSPLVFITPIVEINPVLTNLNQDERSFTGATKISTNERHTPMTQVTIFKRHVQKHYNEGNINVLITLLNRGHSAQLITPRLII